MSTTKHSVNRAVAAGRVAVNKLLTASDAMPEGILYSAKREPNQPKHGGGR